jgi:hypothetical protein
MQMKKIAWVLVGALALMGGLGCEGEKPTGPATKTSTLQDTKPKAAGAHEFEITDTDDKNPGVRFEMVAPNEKIRGTLVKATTGKLQIPLDDITKTSGHLYVDLGKLLVVQNKPDDDGKFTGEFKENKLQNDHAKEWLQVTCDESADGKKVADDQMDACQKEAKLNKNVEFVIEKVETATKDVTKLTGDTRKVIATVSGTFLLHQIAKPQSAKVEITFVMKGDKPVSIAFKTVEPFSVKLADHVIGPNDAFGKFAKGTLSTLEKLGAFQNEHKKVAEAAEVSFDITAKFTKMSAGGAKGAPSAASSAKK